MGSLWTGTAPQLKAGVPAGVLTRLGDELTVLCGTGCRAHVDVMDGSLCPLLGTTPATTGPRGKEHQ